MNTISTYLRLTLWAGVVLFSAESAFSQSIGNYNTPTAIQRTTGITYNSIEFTGSAFPAWRNNVIGNSTEDDNRSEQVSIGFDFWYNGVRYTDFSVSTNGFLDFSSATFDGGPGIGTRQFWPYGPYDQDLSTPNRTVPAGGGVLTVAPFYYDLTTQGEIDPLGGSIKYLVSGVAPNRVLTVEWIRMAVWGNTTPSLNYQVKLYESTGVLEFIYGTMTTGTVSWAYSVGINGPVLSSVPTAAQLLLQQTANTATFSNANGAGAQNLTTIPASNSMITFTPPPMNAPTSLTFSGISQTGMTLNWTDNSTNEVGFVIYRSDDGGATYNFITQTAANATSYAMTSLLAGTNYYYRVYAVNEGRLSSALTGNQMTASPGSPYTTSSGSWKNPTTWSTGIVPGISDNATISDGHTIYIDSTVTVNSLTIGNGTSGVLLIGDNNTPRSITVIGNIDVKSGGIFRVNGASNTSAHAITTSGNILNAGRFVMATDADSRCAVTFNKSGTQTISGNGDSTYFYTMTLNMGASKNNILDVFATNFKVSGTNFLTITNGSFNLATGANITPFTSTVTIPTTGGIRINHASAVLNTTGGNLIFAGELKVQNGTLNIGNASDQGLVSSGGIFDFSGGTTNVAGRFEPNNNYVITDFTMSGGTLNVGVVGSTSTTNAPFTMNVSGSKFTMTGGSIVIRREGGGGADDLGFINTGYSTYTVTGGTLQIGDGSTPAGQTMRINTTIPVYNLLVNSANATATLITNNLIVKNDVNITAGTLNANGLNMNVGGNWTDATTFTPSTGKVTFDGTGVQTITDATGETFNKLSIDKPSGSVVLANNVSVNDSLNNANGILSIGNTTLTVNAVFVNSATFQTGTSGTVNYNQGSNGQNVLPLNYANLTFSNFNKVLPNSGTVGVSNLFTPGAAAGHTITGSTINYNGSGAQTVAPFAYNNFTVSNAGVKTLSSGTATVAGIATIGASNTLTVNGTFQTSGSVANSGIQNGSGTFQFVGASAQALSGGGQFQNLTVNNASGITMTGNTIVNGTLTFTTGTITTGSDTLTSLGTISRTVGHVNGWLKKNVSTGTNIAVTYELGDAANANYAPVTFTFASISTGGTITARSVGTEHPNIITSFIDPTNNVNRYWQLVNSGGVVFTNYAAVFTFRNPGDLDITGSETTYRTNIYRATVWDSTTAGTRTTTTNQATGLTQIGDYAVGVQVTSGAYRTKQTGNWNAVATWERFNGIAWVNAVATPTSADGLITVRSGHTVTVTANVTIDQTIIEAGGQITINGGNLTLAAVNNALTVFGTLRWQANTLSGATAARLIFNAGSLYQHAMNNASQVAIPTASWNATSTCEITGATTSNATFVSAASLSQNFGNFTWNSPGQSGNIILNGLLNNIAGTLTVTNTNAPTRYLALYNGNAGNTTIGGSITVNGANAWIKLQDGTSSPRFYVGGDINVSNGILSLTDRNAVDVEVNGGLYVTGGTFRIVNRNGTIDSVYIKGNMVHSAGTITDNGTSGSGTIAFNGTDKQTYTGGGTVSGTVNYSVLTGSTLSLGANTVTGNLFELRTGATLEIGSPAGITTSGATGNIQVVGTRTFSTGANYVYNGSSAQSTGNGLPATVNILEINNTAGVSLTSSVAVTDSVKLTAGVFGIASNTLTINNVAYLASGSLTSNADGTVIYNKASNGQSVIPLTYGNLTFSNFNKILPSGSVGVAGVFTPGNAMGHTTTGNTIDYNGSGAQSVTTWAYYNNLTVSGTNWKQLTGNTLVNGNLSVSNGTLSDSIYTLTVKGNITNNSLITGSGQYGKTILNGGSSVHTLSGTGTYRILELNDSYGAASSGNVTIDSILVLTNGIISLGSNSLICNVVPGVYRPVAGGHVNGKITKNISVSGIPVNYTFEVGDASNYTPIDMTFQSVSVGGTVTAFQTPGDHPLVKYSGLEQTKSVNRYYTITGSGLTFTTYDATMNFVASDIDAGANTAYFFVKRYNAPSWFPSTTNVRQSTSTRTLGVTAFGEFVVGEASNTFYWTKGAGTYNWSDDYNWSSHSQPTAGNDVVFDGKDTIEVNINGTCNNLIIQNDTLRLTILAGKTLSIMGNVTQYSGIFSTRASFPTVSGTVSLSGGTFGYDSTGGTQSVSPQTYNNLRITGGGTKTSTGDFTVNKNLTIGSGATFSDGGNTITVKDSITNNGIHAGTGKILLNGSTQHRLYGTGTFQNVQLNNSSNGVTLDSNLTVNGVLTLTNGIITAPNDTLFMTQTASVVRTNGYVNGNMRKNFIAAADSLTFEIGTATNYLPVTVNFGTITTPGNLTIQMLSSEHPDIDNSTVDKDSSINRYWVLNNNGIAFDTYNVTVNWVSGDVDAGVTTFSDFIMAIKSNGVWDELESGTVTATSMRGMNGTSFSSFAVGKPSSKLFTSVQTGNWSIGTTWDRNSVPKKRDKVLIVSPHVVTLVDARKIAEITLNSGATLTDGGNTLDLYGNFTFSGTWSGNGMIRWNANTADTLKGSGGKATGSSTLYVGGTNKVITASADTLNRIEIPSAYTLTNNGAVQVGRLIGGAAGATLVNGSGATLSVSDTLLQTGTLTAVAANNTVKYDGTGNQNVKATNYVNLMLSGTRSTNSITVPASTITIAGTFTPNALFTSGNYITTGSTIDFNTTNAQTIPAFPYNNLTVSGSRTTNNVTLVANDTIKVAGTFSPTATFSTGAYVNTNNWFNFNGTGAQTIPAFNYNGLKITGARTTNNVTLANSGTIGIAGSFLPTATFSTGNYVNTGSTVNFNGSTAQTIPGFSYNNLTVSGSRTTNNVTLVANDTIKVAGTFSPTATFSTGAFVNTNNWFNFNGTGAQTIPAFNYNGLKITGARTTNNVTLANSGTIGIAGSFLPTATFSTGNYVNTGSTVNFNGSTAQTIPGFSYNNLTVSGSRTTNNVTLVANDTIKVAGTFSPTATFSTGAYVNTNNWFNFNGTGAQAIPAFNYNGLKITGARTTNNVTLAGSGTIGIAGSFLPTATFSTGNYVNTGSTINYNGSGAQSIIVFPYNNLQTATGGTKTPAGNLVIAGNIVIGSSTTFSAGATTDSIYGNFTNNGTFTAGTSLIVFKGSSNASITGATTFNNIVVLKNSSSTTLTLNNDVQVSVITMTTGTVQTGANTLTITNTRNGSGIILGRITRTHTIMQSVAYEFESPNNTITFSSTGVMPTSVTVTVVLDSTAIINTNMNPINRYYTVSQSGGSGLQYALKLHYEDAELGTANSETTPPLKIWRDSSGTWVRMGASSNNTTNNWVQYDSVVNFTTFSLSSRTITNVSLVLAANATYPAPGDQVEYTVSYSNSGDGPATNFIVVAPIPLNTAYVTNSVTVNGTPKADGSPGVSVGANSLTINLSTVLGGAIAPGSSGNFKYKVSIN